MGDELTKKAVEMLLKGATLLREPCPYCFGVRVMKDGYALCVTCGREPKQKEINEKPTQEKATSISMLLEKKLELLSKELENETDHIKQQNILKTINSVIETIENLKNKQ